MDKSDIQKAHSDLQQDLEKAGVKKEINFGYLIAAIVFLAFSIFLLIVAVPLLQGGEENPFGPIIGIPLMVISIILLPIGFFFLGTAFKPSGAPQLVISSRADLDSILTAGEEIIQTWTHAGGKRFKTLTNQQFLVFASPGPTKPYKLRHAYTLSEITTLVLDEEGTYLAINGKKFYQPKGALQEMYEALKRQLASDML
jgi:hypothetical protein